MGNIDQRGQTVERQVNIINEQQPTLLNLHQIGEPVADFDFEDYLSVIAIIEGRLNLRPEL